MRDYILGFDIGGTKCAVVLAYAGNGIELLDRISFPTEKGFEATRDKLFGAGNDILRKNNIAKDNLLAIGVSCGGPLNSHDGVILSPPHLPGWDAIPITEILEAEFGVKAFLQNDANACALVEWMLGAGKGVKNMVFLTMGTGFGAGIILEGKLIEGKSCLAGEIGHVRLEQDGPEGFGKRGSVEAFCSGAGIANIAKLYTEDAIKNGAEPSWAKEINSSDEITAKLIAEYAVKGDSDAIEIYRRTGASLGKVLSVLVDLLNPEVIVIGSIFVRCETLLCPEMERILKSESLPQAYKDCKILPARTGERLGDYAGILTACYALGIDVVPEESDLKPGVMNHYDRLFHRYPSLIGTKNEIAEAFFLLRRVFRKGKKLLVCGNGGSAADAEHIVGELMKGFYLPRNSNVPDIAGVEGLQGALRAIALTGHVSLTTALINDVSSDIIFAQQVYGYADKGDALLCISTSGNAENVIQAARVAKSLDVKVIGLVGANGGKLKDFCDVLIAVPGECTADVQELHMPVYHTLCAMLEEEFFGNCYSSDGN